MPARYTFSHAQAMNWPVLMAVPRNIKHPGVVLDRFVCVVGARCLVHLPLEVQTVSKAHALLVRDTDGVYLRDLSSRNQTFVNESPVREARLELFDRVRFGPFQYRCELGFAQTGASPSIPSAELWPDPDGLGSRHVVSIEQRTFLVGSRNNCDLVIQSPEVASAHAVVFVRGGRRCVRDLSTPTGTFVNDLPIREAELHEGDRMRIGGYGMEYHCIGQPLPATAEQPHMAETMPRHTDEASWAGEIVLPWDEPGPIEVEMVESDAGDSDSTRKWTIANKTV